MAAPIGTGCPKAPGTGSTPARPGRIPPAAPRATAPPRKSPAGTAPPSAHPDPGRHHPALRWGSPPARHRAAPLPSEDPDGRGAAARPGGNRRGTGTPGAIATPGRGGWPCAKESSRPGRESTTERSLWPWHGPAPTGQTPPWQVPAPELPHSQDTPRRLAQWRTAPGTRQATTGRSTPTALGSRGSPRRENPQALTAASRKRRAGSRRR